MHSDAPQPAYPLLGVVRSVTGKRNWRATPSTRQLYQPPGRLSTLLAAAFRSWLDRYFDLISIVSDHEIAARRAIDMLGFTRGRISSRNSPSIRQARDSIADSVPSGDIAFGMLLHEMRYRQFDPRIGTAAARTRHRNCFFFCLAFAASIDHLIILSAPSKLTVRTIPANASGLLIQASPLTTCARPQPVHRNGVNSLSWLPSSM